MANIRIRFVQSYVVNGRSYHYFRKPGCARIKLPGLPGSEAFMAAYQAALAADAPPSDIDTFRDLADETRRTRWPILRRFGDEHGTKRVAMLKREHVDAMLRNKRPNPRQNFLKVLRPLISFAISIGWIKDDPTRDLRASVRRGAGFKPWGDDQIAAFRSVHPIGSRRAACT
jgi:hypothetical protein